MYGVNFSHVCTHKKITPSRFTHKHKKERKRLPFTCFIKLLQELKKNKKNMESHLEVSVVRDRHGGKRLLRFLLVLLFSRPLQPFHCSEETTNLVPATVEGGV